jgi:hypothetical protein
MTGSDASYLDDMLSYALDAIESLGDAGRDLTILADTARIRSPSSSTSGVGRWGKARHER